MKLLLIFSIVTLSLAQIPETFFETRPPQVFPVTTGTPHFVIDLDYPQAFEVSITSFNNNNTVTSFCETTPSRIASRIEYSGPIDLITKNDSSGNPIERFYDNIVLYKGWYFIIDSASFEIVAIKDFADPSTYITIGSEFENEKEDEQWEDTYLIVDPDDHLLYVITKVDIYSYSLSKFLTAVQDNKTPPKVNGIVEGLPGYGMILSIRYYQHRLYVVGDSNVDVFSIDKKGDLTLEIKFDHTFFSTQEIQITDIVLKDNFAYVLDKLKGVYVIDISKADSTEKIPVMEKYIFRPDSTREVQKGQFIEIVGNSLQVISTGAKTNFIFEYIIKPGANSPTLEFNRKIELFQSIKDTFTDSNFLYLITGFFNMASKHSVPGHYHSKDVNNYLEEYWPLLDARALVSETKGTVSKVAVISEDSLTIMRFWESNPFISCNTGGLTEGSYVYTVHAAQKDCEAKRAANVMGFDKVCEIIQDIEILMVKNTIDVGNVAESKKKISFLWVGVGVLALFIIVFMCLFKRYKTKFHILEDRMKFHKLDEDNTDAGIKKGGSKKEVDSQQDINPYNINIAAELRKEEEKEKRKSPNKSPKKLSQAEKDEEKPNAEFGDLKPLDIEEIYGHKDKTDKDDSF